MRLSLRRIVPALVAAFTVTCVDSPTGPRGPSVPTTFAIAPTFSQSATRAKAMYSAAGFDIDHVRLLITRPVDVVVKDTVVEYNTAQGDLPLELNVIGPVGEQLTVKLEYLAGTIVLYSGSAIVQTVSLITPAEQVPQTTLIIDAVGPGFDATSVTVSPSSGTFPTTGTVAFSAKAFNGAAEIPGALFGWSVDDETVATIDANGLLHPTAKGGNVKVRATTLNEVFGEVSVTLFAPAASLSLVSGGGQSAVAGSTLTQIVVKVANANGGGVAGEEVTFAVASGGGSIVVDNGTTDASGLARVTWTLGATAGSQSITAARAGLTGSPLTITATATSATATKLGFVAQPATHVAGAAMPAIQVAAQDASGATMTSFTGPITVAIASNPGSATLGGTVTVNAVAGVASFSTLTLNASGSGYTLAATSAGLTGATSSAFNATAGTATALQWVTQPTNTLQGAAISPPVSVKVLNNNGALITTATNIVTIAIGTNPGGSTLGGNPSGAALFGIASFSTLTLNNAGTGYTLTASATGLTGATSAAFNIVAPAAATRSWSGTVSTAWTDPSNWSPSGVPAASDSVVIPGGTAFSPTIGANVSVAAIVVQSGAVLTAGALQVVTLPGQITNQGTLNLNGTVLLGSLDNQGLTVTQGAVTVGGAITNAAGATLRVQGSNAFNSAALVGAAGFTNRGTLEMTDINSGWGALISSAGTGITNTATGTIAALQGSGGDRDISGAIDNQGTISITTTSGVDFVQAGTSSINSGSINVTSGDFRMVSATIADAFTNAGTVTIASGRKWTVNGGTLNLAGGTTTGAGTLDLNGVSVGSFSTAAVTSLLNFDAATTVVGNLISIGSGEQLRMAGGNVTAAVSVQSGGVYFTQGLVTQSGALTLPTGATLRLQGNPSFGTSTFTVANGFTNAGTIEVTDLGGHAATLGITAGTLTIAPAGVFTMTGTGARTLAVQLDNQGTMHIADNLTLAKPSAVHTNSGTINVTGGTFTLTQSGTTPSFTNTGTVAISSTRTWNVTGGALGLAGGTTSGAGALDMNGVAVTFSSAAVTTLLNFDAASTVVGNLITVGNGEQVRMAGGTVTAAVTLVSGGIYFAQGSVNQNGALTVPAGATVRIQGNPTHGTAQLTLANGYTNDGAIELQDVAGHAVTFAITNGSLTNAPGGIFTMTGTGSRTLALQLINQGTMTIADNLTLAKASAVHSNSGTINVTGGSLTLTQSGTTPSFTNTGTVAISSTRTWIVNGGALVLTGGTTSGAGTLDLNGVAATFSTAAVTTLLNFDAATTIAGNLITIGSGEQLRMVGGTVTADVAVASGGMYFSQGAVNQDGTLTVPTGATLRLQGNPTYGTSTFTLANGYTNDGTLELTDLSGHAVTMAITNGSLTNPAGGTFTMTGTGTRTLALQLVNQGTMTFPDNITLAKASAAHTNSGAINVTGGVFTLAQSGTTPSFTNTGTVAISSTRTWNVTGGSLVLTGGTTSGAGTLDLNGVAATFSTAAVTTLLNFDAATTVTGNLITIGNGEQLRMVGGTVTADVSVASGGIYLSQGAVNQNGTLLVPAGGTLRLQGNPTYGTSAFTLLNGYTNDGTLELTDLGGHAVAMTITNGSLTNPSGGTFTMTGTGTRTLALQLVNQGTMTLPDNLTLAKASAVHSNSGAINVTGGTFTLTQSGTTPSFTNTGIVNIVAGRTWLVSGGSLGVSGGATIGDGILDLNGVATTFSTTAVKAYLNTDAATTFAGNLITVAANDSLRMVGGTMTAAVNVQNIGTYYVQGAVTQLGVLTLPSGASLKLEGNPSHGTASLTVANGFTNSGFIDMSSTGGHGAVLGITTGALTHAAGATFLLSGTGTRTLNANLVNQGTFSPALGMTINGQVTNLSTFSVPSSVPLTIAGPLVNSGNFTIAGNQIVTINAPGAAHTNSGTITLPSITSGTLNIGATGATQTFSNTGTISVGAGRTLALLGNTAFTNGVGGVYTGPTGGTLNVAATSTFTNNGIIAPGGVGVAGTMNYVGAWNPGAGGTITSELASAITYDRLAITGAATFAGTLNISLLSPYTAGQGAAHDIITFTTQNGAFGAINRPGICGTNPVVSGTSYRLTC